LHSIEKCLINRNLLQEKIADLEQKISEKKANPQFINEEKLQPKNEKIDEVPKKISPKKAEEDWEEFVLI